MHHDARVAQPPYVERFRFSSRSPCICVRLLLIAAGILRRSGLQQPPLPFHRLFFLTARSLITLLRIGRFALVRLEEGARGVGAGETCNT